MGMGSSRKMDYRQYKRINREERGQIYILINGETERHYFDSFKGSGRLISVEFYRQSNLKLLERARSVQREPNYLQNDEIWIVIDRDAVHSNPNDKKNFVDTLKQAEENNIKVAYSNPGFEIWYLLHFKYEANSLDMPRLEAQLNQQLKQNKQSAYKKPAAGIHKYLSSRQAQAIKNSNKLMKKHQNPVNDNPTTNVGILVAKLNERVQRLSDKM